MHVFNVLAFFVPVPSTLTPDTHYQNEMIITLNSRYNLKAFIDFLITDASCNGANFTGFGALRSGRDPLNLL